MWAWGGLQGGQCTQLAVSVLLRSQHSICVLGAAVDACRDACNRVVCNNMHQVPAWNEACESRCSAECQKGRAS